MKNHIADIRKVITKNGTAQQDKALLTDDKVIGLIKEFYDKYQGKGLTPSEILELHWCEYWQKILTAQAEQTRQATLREVGEWLEKKNYVRFIPECGSDLCFLATEGFENEVPEPEDGARGCPHREQCRLWNKDILDYKKDVAALKAGKITDTKD